MNNHDILVVAGVWFVEPVTYLPQAALPPPLHVPIVSSLSTKMFAHQ